MNDPGWNEGFARLDDFDCEAIAIPSMDCEVGIPPSLPRDSTSSVRLELPETEVRQVDELKAAGARSPGNAGARAS
jgi:hypothetical protein